MVRSISKLAGALFLVLGLSVALPAAAEAGHRHSRSCNHRSGYYDSYGYSGYDNGRYSDYGRYSYEYRYRPRPYYYSYYDPYPRHYYAPRPRVYVHYHRGYRCTRPHVSLNLRF